MARAGVYLVAVLAGWILSHGVAAAVEVRIDFDPGVDFSGFETFAWGEGTPAEDEILERRIHASIERELVPLGFKEVREDADFLIVTHAAMDQSREIDVTQHGYWQDYEGWKRPIAVSQDSWSTDRGVLVVDLLDAANGRLIWRGVATGNVAKKPEKRGEKLDATMAKMFKRFPPK